MLPDCLFVAKSFNGNNDTHFQTILLTVSDLFAHTKHSSSWEGSNKESVRRLFTWMEGCSGNDVTNTLTPSVGFLLISYLSVIFFFFATCLWLAPQQLAGVVRCVRPSGLWWCIINLFGRNPAEHHSAGEEMQHLPTILSVKQTVSSGAERCGWSLTM